MCMFRGALASLAVKFVGTDSDTGIRVAMISHLGGNDVFLSGRCFDHSQGQFIGFAAGIDEVEDR